MVGSHGIETRYPFLDQDVVQEYLWWLTSSANNFEYKRPVAGFITHEVRRYFTRFLISVKCVRVSLYEQVRTSLLFNEDSNILLHAD